MKKIGSLLLIFMLLTGVCFTGCQSQRDVPQTQTTAGETVKTSEASYTESLFDTSRVHEINVEIAEDDWKNLLANPLNKTKYAVDVTIDGTKVKNVSFATKGNTSLSQVASSDSDRYSFKINFGKYEKGQTYQGLDKLNLNNIMSDATYMKDYLSYLIMRQAGVSAPLTSYVSLSVNGELHGLYLAIEDVSDSFLERNYQSSDGALYKPETEHLNNAGNAPDKKQGDNRQNNNDGQDATAPSQNNTAASENSKAQNNTDQDATQPSQGSNASPNGNMTPPNNGQMPQGNMQPPNNGQMPQGDFQPPNNGQMPQGDFQPPTNADGSISEPPQGMPQGGPQGMDGDSKGADLKYSDDKRDSYADIFDNEENDVTEDDEKELIAAIKALNSGENIEQYWDMDAVIRYFVAHNFVLNYDSYTGTMLHNYYLYETDGKVTVLPWDYNLAFGGFQGDSDATSAVNRAIDSPLSGTTEENRPLWNVIVSNKTYLETYHRYYSELLSQFFDSGKCSEEIDRVYNMIRSYVEKDPSAFYSADAFDTAVKTLKAFCEKRAESIGKQLSGALGSTTDTQKAEDKVDASSLTLSDMGSQGGEKGRDGMPNGGPPNGMQPPQMQQSTTQPTTAAEKSS